MKVIERRIVNQDWYETELSKTGWDSHGWYFEDGSSVGSDWTVVSYIHIDKFGNPFMGIAEREITISE